MSEQKQTLADALNRDLHETAQTDGARALRRYFEILSDDVANGDQVEEIKSLMPLLHKTAADVERDAKVVSEAKRLQAVIRQGRDLRGAIEAAGKAAEDKAAEARALQERMMRELVSVREENSRLQGLRDDAERAIATLEDLKRNNPALLADVPVIDAASLN
jgi:uncharacterized Zn finger protein (UPF0148 family)